MRSISLIVVHCSATDIQHDIHDIDDWHKKRGFKRSQMPKNAYNQTDLHIGYHFFIDKLGRIFKGRNEEEVGAHVAGHNANSLGICFEGNDLFNDAQFRSGQFLIASLLMKYDLEICHVLPHNALDKVKSCPRFDINEKLLKNIFTENQTEEIK